MTKDPARRGRPTKAQPGPSDRGSAPEVERIAAIVLQRVEQKIEQHLHLPITMPDHNDLEQMRMETPEAYAAYLRMVEERASTDASIDRSRFDLPYRLASRGQVYGLAALVAVLVLCGYVASLGSSTAVIVAGVIAALDLVAIIATLMGSNTGSDNDVGR